ncbi:MAG: transposase [Desulfovibrio sp.]|nr:transposase [Desulfovibrio sp.]
MCLCLRDPRINSTNNFAERQIRSAVCQRKISIGSASEKGERWIERSLSVRKTCALQKKSYFEILVDALKSYFNKTGLNLYWIHKAASRAFYAFSPSHAIWGGR